MFLYSLKFFITFNFRTISQELSDAILQMVANCTNLYMSKVASARLNPVAPPPSILRTSQHHRPLEGGPSSQVLDQLTGLAGLATSLASLGLNPSAQSGSTFTLPGLNYYITCLIKLIYFRLFYIIIFCIFLGSLGQLVQTPGSPSRNIVGNTSGHGGFSIMTPSIAPGPAVSSQLSGPSNMLGRLPPQQVAPSVIGKSNHSSKCPKNKIYYIN